MTAAGRALYEREWARYSELYPHIEAPSPRVRKLAGCERARPLADPG